VDTAVTKWLRFARTKQGIFNGDGNMIKSVLLVSALSLGMLSLNVSAHDGQDKHASKSEHGHQAGKHEHESEMGQEGIASKVTRTIQVDMSDAMRYSPSNITVKKGETVKFVVKNSGKIKHEMVLGSAKELKEHADMMRKMPEMVHADANMVSVDPGKSGEIIWKFSKAGTFEFACLQPGHFEAGMKGQVKVASR
jgi:uncharacterized cupredoxin-like copper-binding protein